MTSSTTSSLNINNNQQIAVQNATSSSQDPDLVISPAHEKDIQHDEDEGKKYAQDVLKEYKVDTDPAINARVQKIAVQLVEIANSHHLIALWGDKRFSKFPFKFTVLQGDDVNAFSLPGGYVYIFDGLLKYVESDDELAGVLGHEMSHIEFRHVATLERDQSKLSIFTFPLILFGLLTSGGSGLTAVSLGQLLDQSTGSGWSQNAELAADYGGFQILTFSKYNPVAMLTLMEHYARDERVSPNINLGIYRTHPPSQARARALEGYLEADHLPLDRSAVSTSFSISVKPEDGGVVAVYFNKDKIFGFAGADAVTRAEAASKTLNKFLDSQPEVFQVQIGPDGNPTAEGNTLFDITPDDLIASKLKSSDLSAQTVNAIKGAIYAYSTRVWMSETSS